MKKKLLGLLSFITIFTASLSSCGETDLTDPRAGFIEYAYKEENLLRLDYSGKNFLTDGIGEVTLASGEQSCIDGDTAHFKGVVGDTSTTVKIRFYGIDTPESTGSIEKWGIPAKNFTKEKLMNAYNNGTIVISIPSTSYGLPSTDSTGTRYLGVVWINETVKNAPYNTLYCLNLLIVQEGYSPNKNSSELEYLAQAFIDANLQAQKYELIIYSDAVDELFPTGEFEAIAIKDIVEEEKRIISNNLTPESNFKYHMKKAVVEGTVTAYAEHVIYLQQYVSDESGDSWYTLPIYVGMSPINTKFTTINTYLKVRGVLESTTSYGLQMTDTNFPTFSLGDDDEAEVVYKAEEIVGTDYEAHIIDVNKTDLDHSSYDYLDYLYCKINILDELTVTGGYDNNSSGDQGYTLYVTNTTDSYSFNISVPFYYRDDSDTLWYHYSDFVNKTIKIKGVYSSYIYNNNRKYIVIPSLSSDIEIVG